jgi:hypothetical protein
MFDQTELVEFVGTVFLRPSGGEVSPRFMYATSATQTAQQKAEESQSTNQLAAVEFQL